MNAEAGKQASEVAHHFNFDSRWTYMRFWKINVPIYHPRIGRYIPNENEAQQIEASTKKIWERLAEKLSTQGQKFDSDKVRIGLGSKTEVEMWAVANITGAQIRGPIELVPNERVDWKTGKIKDPYQVPHFFNAAKYKTSYPGNYLLKPDQLTQLYNEIDGASLYQLPTPKEQQEHYQESFTS